MTITFTQTWRRPSTNVQFHVETDLPRVRLIKEIETKYPDLIKPTYVYSDDGLELTKTQAHASIDSVNITRSEYKTVDLDYESMTFTANTGQTQVNYLLAGIDGPFTVTTVYTFPAGTDVQFLLDALSSFPNRAVDVQTTDTTVTASHFYRSTDDWNVRRWIDYKLVPQLHNLDISRRETWAMFTS